MSAIKKAARIKALRGKYRHALTPSDEYVKEDSGEEVYVGIDYGAAVVSKRLGQKLSTKRK